MDAHKFLKASDARTKRGLVTFDIDLTTAIVDRVINSPGTLFYLDKASTGICSVEGSVDQGTSGSPLLASAGFSLFNESGFSGFRLSAPAQPGKMIRLVIASGVTIKPGDPVTAGSTATSIIDAAQARSEANAAFMNYIQAPASAGVLPMCELWNAAGTGKRGYLESFSVSSPTAQAIQIGFWNGAFSNAGTAVLNKNITGAVGALTARYTTNATPFFLVGGPVFNLTANTPFVVNFREPVLIPEGYGFVTSGLTVNTVLNTNHEWFEK